MSYTISALHIEDNSLESRVMEAVMSEENVTPEEAVLRIIRQYQPSPSDVKLDYGSFFGSVKGPGSHGSPEAVDSYVRELRDEW